MRAYFGAITFIFGLVLGSFLNCTAIRITKKEDWVKGRSHCVTCGHELAAKDLIPLFSYFSTKGKCRYCGEKISKRYPITELIFGLLTLILYILEDVHGNVCVELFGGGDALLIITPLILYIRDLILTGTLFVISLVDLDTLEIPDGCINLGIATWLITSPFAAIRYNVLNIDPNIQTFIAVPIISLPSYINYLINHIGVAALVLILILGISLIMDKVLKKESLGGGDIKLFVMLSLYLGGAGAYELILFSSIMGLIFAAVRKCINKNASKEFPFGPAIAAAGYILIIYSNQITKWYFNVFL